MAGVIGQQRIDANRAFSGKMLVDHLVRQRFHLAMAAIRTLDARFLANAGAPVIGADWGIARFAGRRILPSYRVDIGAATK